MTGRKAQETHSRDELLGGNDDDDGDGDDDGMTTESEKRGDMKSCSIRSIRREDSRRLQHKQTHVVLSVSLSLSVSPLVPNYRLWLLLCSPCSGCCLACVMLLSSSACLPASGIVRQGESERQEDDGRERERETRAEGDGRQLTT